MGWQFINGVPSISSRSGSSYWTPLITDSDVLARYIFDNPDNLVSNDGTLTVQTMMNKLLNGFSLGDNKIANPSFDTVTTGWTFDGNHAGARITTDFVSTPACLEVTSTGAGSQGSNRIRISAGYAGSKIYKVSFYAKSISGNTSLSVTDSAQEYTKVVTLTTSWVLYEYYFYDPTASGTILVMFIGGVAVFRLDDVVVNEVTLTGINLVTKGTAGGILSKPILEAEDILLNGAAIMTTDNFAETPLSIYIVGEKYVITPYDSYSGVQVFNRVNEFGDLINNLTVGKDNSWVYGKQCKIKEILVRKTDDSYRDKVKINNYYKYIYNAELPEITNRDILINKILPYCNEDNFIFCTANDFHHYEHSFLPLMIDLIKSNSTVLSNLKFISAHGDTALRLSGTALAFIAYFNYNIIPNLAKGIPIYLGMGNHNTGTLGIPTIPVAGDEKVANVLTNAQQQTTYIDPVLAIDEAIVTDAANLTGRYYYKDFADKKLRFIYLNQYDSPDTNDGTDYTYRRDAIVFSEAQLTWLCDYALNLPDSDYHVAIIVHDPAIVSDLDIRALLTAFKTNGAFDITINAYGRSYNLVKDFSTINNFNGVLVGVFMGHDHYPAIQSEGGIYWITNIAAYMLLTGWDRSVGSLGEYASDFVVINKANRNIKMLRYGAMRAIAGDPSDNGDRGFANNTYDTIMNY